MENTVCASVCLSECVSLSVFVWRGAHDLWDFSFQPGIELGPLAVRVQSPNHWTAREFPI